jgi:hypothetical protein
MAQQQTLLMRFEMTSSRHLGTWKDDKISGQGKSTYPNGNEFEGHWINGKINGVGEFHLQLGTSLLPFCN